jgi:UDP-glucose 4-epimerase
VRVLVTGHRGAVGRPVAERLAAAGHAVVGFDLVDGDDLLDPGAVRRAALGCEAVVHLAALAHDSAGPPEQIMAVNVVGTWHVLLAAEHGGAGRVVYVSSCQALGIAEGERHPDYFPVDDDHPRRAQRPYGLSKRLAEDLCEAFSARTGVPTVALRPVAVWGDETYRRIEAQRRALPRSQWEPFWEYGAFVDVRDVATAVALALEVGLDTHHRLLLCAPDISASAPSLELARRLTPDVPVRHPERYSADPWCALVDCSAARRVPRVGGAAPVGRSSAVALMRLPRLPIIARSGPPPVRDRLRPAPARSRCRRSDAPR